MLLNDYKIRSTGTKEEIKKYMGTNENENTTYPNLWDTTKAVLRRKFIVIQVYLKKDEKFQIII